MKTMLTIFASFIVLSNCHGGANDPSNTSLLVYSVDSVEIDNKSGKEITLKMKCTVPNPCYSFSHINTSQSADTLKIEVFVQTDPDMICIQVIGEIEIIKAISIKENTTFLHFLGRSKSFTRPIN